MIRFNGVEIDRVNRTVWHGCCYYRWFKFNGHAESNHAVFRLCEHLLLSGGMTRQQLFDALYSDCADGGPLSSGNIISVHLAHLKPVLDRLQLRLRTRRHNSETVYWITQ